MTDCLKKNSFDFEGYFLFWPFFHVRVCDSLLVTLPCAFTILGNAFANERRHDELAPPLMFEISSDTIFHFRILFLQFG